jgi:hypothetical protein
LLFLVVVNARQTYIDVRPGFQDGRHRVAGVGVLVAHRLVALGVACSGKGVCDAKGLGVRRRAGAQLLWVRFNAQSLVT